MSKERTLENISNTAPLYVDNYSWKFYEGGINIEPIPHSVRLTITKIPEDKVPVVMITLETEKGHTILRLSPYEFSQLNALFKRASFRLEKV